MVGLATVSFVLKETRPAQERVESSLGSAFKAYGVLLRDTQALITQMAQTAVCNRHHSLDQQLCRWLLLSLDRLNGTELVMTQELIANMLGVRREGVTNAAGALQRGELISYSRGIIKILDRAGLEAVSCECYQIIKDESDGYLTKGRSRDFIRGAHNGGR